MKRFILVAVVICAVGCSIRFLTPEQAKIIDQGAGAVAQIFGVPHQLVEGLLAGLLPLVTIAAHRRGKVKGTMTERREWTMATARAAAADAATQGYEPSHSDAFPNTSAQAPLPPTKVQT